MKLRIGYLYPDLMNIYGDRGNVLTLVKRCLWRGIDVDVAALNPGDRIIHGEYDIFFMGGGQDREQVMVCKDLQDVKGEDIKREIE
ncbi:MAG: glutamine amidotransferase, partial [Actinobacteria bacterium]|nr:glutamine amidotransferase [Actinomycetota bacterium]